MRKAEFIAMDLEDILWSEKPNIWVNPEYNCPSVTVFWPLLTVFLEFHEDWIRVEKGWNVNVYAPKGESKIFKFFELQEVKSYIQNFESQSQIHRQIFTFPYK